ncbi:MAG: RHS repeat-associated core domain-containing protein [Verrucomicrobia bacterium]|nr:RHS repeat-associated core domain-containing protein [Verrucomicrobiota bacterium]
MPAGAEVGVYIDGRLVGSIPAPATSSTADFGTLYICRERQCPSCRNCTPKLLAGLNSVDFEVLLGRAGPRDTPLSLKVKSDTLTATTAAAPAFQLVGGLSSAVQIIGADTDQHRQFVAPQWMADLAEVRSGGILQRTEVKLYHGAGTLSGGFFPGVDLFKTFTFTPSTAGTVQTLTVTETIEGGTKDTLYSYNSSTGQWTLTADSGARKVTLNQTVSGPTRTVIREIRDAANTLVSKDREVFTTYAWGERLTSRVLDPDGQALTETWEYETNSALPAYKRLTFTSNEVGYWQKFSYDTTGRITKTVSCYLNTPPTAAESDCRVNNTTYDGDNRTEWETLRGQEVARRYVIVTTTGGKTTERVEVCTVPGAALGATTNLVTSTEYDTNGEIISRPDGTIQKTAYTTLSGGGLRTTVETGKAVSGAVTDGTRSVVETDSMAHQNLATLTDITSGELVSQALTTETDAFGRAEHIDYLDSTSELFTYGCCGLDQSTDRDGVTTVFGHDDFGNVNSEFRAGITLGYSYDPLGHLLRSTRTGTDSVEITTGGADYNLAGRQTATYGLLGTTGVTETNVTGGGLQRTETLPGNFTRITTTAADGQILSLSGTAAHPRTFSYEEQSGAQITKETLVGENGATTEFTKTFTDMAGRTSRIEASGRGAVVKGHNAKGQLASSTDADGVVTLFGYNDRGELETTAIDLDRDGQINAGDPATTTVTSVTGSGTTAALRVTTSEASENGPITTSVTDRFVRSRTISQTNYGLSATTATTLVGTTRTDTTTLPDDSTLTRVTTDGRPASEVHSGGGNTSRSLSYEYDPRGRLWKITDGRVNTVTTYGYYDNDRVHTITQGDQTVTYGYDDLGYRNSEALPGTRTLTRTFKPTGEILTVGGTASYPTSFTYDPQGRMTTMTTATGTTTWVYDPVTGRLERKKDATQKPTIYTHTLAGRLDTRLWARGILTDFGYDDAGRLSTIDYSDATPDVGILYDQRNRPRQITDAAGTRVPAFTDAGQPDGETITGGILGGLSTDTGYDTLQRKNAFTFSRSNAPLASTGWGYDALSRLETVTQGIDMGTYVYHPNSRLVNTLTLKRGTSTVLTTTKTFDALDRIDVVSSVPATGPTSSFDYHYNTAGLRDTVTLADSSRWDIGYNDRAEVTSGARKTSADAVFPGQSFGYAFDAIGNRLTGTTNSRTSIYSPNSLNQYSSRTVPGYFDVLGEAASDATVTVNSQPAERLGSYFRAELAVDNSAAPVWQPTTVTATRDTDTVDLAGHRFVPQASEAFAYDDDGNMTADGRWDNVWDGENRLVSQTASAAAVSAGAPNQQLTYAYDFAGRRIRKTLSTWNTLRWVKNYGLLFLYDGWNLAAEIGDEGGPLLRSYAWGSDLSGGTAAGGIGGLVFIHQSPENKTLAVVADAQGNTSALYDMADASLAASYEYGPFGETLRVSGKFGDANPIRWSTKYVDWETGLAYYGFRYFSPSLGRWLNNDPLGEAGGMNLQGFVSNNPLSLVDPFGLQDAMSRKKAEIEYARVIDTTTDPGALLAAQERYRSEVNYSEYGNARAGADLLKSLQWQSEIVLFAATLPIAEAAPELGELLAARKSNPLSQLSSSCPVTATGSAWRNLPGGVQVRQVGNYWIKQVNPEANNIAQWWARGSLDAQAAGLSKLGDMAPNALYQNGKLITRDAGAYTPGNFWNTWLQGSKRLGTPMNDIRPRNIGASGVIFDPALHPVQRGVYWLGAGAVGATAGYGIYSTFDQH